MQAYPDTRLQSIRRKGIAPRSLQSSVLRHCLFDHGAVSACLIAHGIFKNGAGVRAAGEGAGRVEMVFVDRVDCGGEDFVHFVAEGKDRLRGSRRWSCPRA